MAVAGRVLCAYVPNFAIQIESERQGQNRPLIITHPLDVSRVWACSDDVRAAGVQVGMTLHQAQQLAPAACFIAPDEDTYHQRQATITAVLHQYTEWVETITLGEWCIDWRGFKDEAAFASQLRSALRAASGLPVRVGLANGKYSAQQAARASDWLVIPVGDEAKFLAPFPITELPHLPGEFRRRLELLDLHTQGALAGLSRGAVLAQFGAEIGFWYDLAKGCDPRPLQPDAPPLREVAEKRLLEPTASRVALQHVLNKLALKLSQRLEKRGYQAEALKVVLEDEFGQRIENGQAIKPPSADGERLRSVAQLCLGRLAVSQSVWQVEVVSYPLRPFHLGVQNITFTESGKREKQSKLSAVVETLRRRFGEGILRMAAFIGLPTPLPINVQLNSEGRPYAFTRREQTYRVVSVEDFWRWHFGWWTWKPLHRDYFQVTLRDGSVRVIFQDLDKLEWFLDKGWGWI